MAGDGPAATCVAEGVVKLSTKPLPGRLLKLTFSKPGTYKVTLRAGVCTPQQQVTKTVYITVGKKATATNTTMPRTPTAPATKAPTAPKTRPAVQTDSVREHDNSSSLLFGGLIGAGALIGAGVVAARQHRQH